MYVDSLVQHESHEQHIGVFFSLAGPLAQRLLYARLPGCSLPCCMSNSQAKRSPPSHGLLRNAGGRGMSARTGRTLSNRSRPTRPWRQSATQSTDKRATSPLVRSTYPSLTLGELLFMSTAIDETNDLRKVAARL